MKKYISSIHTNQSDAPKLGRTGGTGALQRQIDTSARQAAQRQWATSLQQPVQRITVEEANAYVSRLTAPEHDGRYLRRDESGAEVEAVLKGAEVEALLKGAEMSAWHTRAYHATKPHNVHSIMARGLDPDRGGSGASQGHENFEAHSQNKVHYTRNIETARDYKNYFEGAEFGKRLDPTPVQAGTARILAITLPFALRTQQEVDPDMKDQVAAAFRLGVLIPRVAIRSLDPVPIPDRPDDSLAYVHQIKGEYENAALYSNLPPAAKTIVDDLLARNGNVDLQTIMHTLKQGMLSMPARDATNMRHNPRARLGLGSRMNAMGGFLRTLVGGS
jgi:hypothetical protein